MPQSQGWGLCVAPQAHVQVGHESAVPGSHGPAGADRERCLSSEWGQLERSWPFHRSQRVCHSSCTCGPAPAMEEAGGECPGQLVPSAHQVAMHLTRVDAQDHT